jgi:phytoene dehydrogenase-like protein
MLLNKNDKITQHYDVIIIGGGLGGLTAANKLAKNGRKVLILESHDKPGGLAPGFYRKKHIFDVSLAWIFRWG